MLSRRAYLYAAGAALAAPVRKPNLIVILADDLGFSDVGAFGGETETPHLDGLAKNGLRFTQMYSCARCMPSRGVLMTGYYSQQSGFEQSGNVKPPKWIRYTPQYLSEAGYRCYHSGKWHVPTPPVAGAGFHQSYFLGDQDRFFSPLRHSLNDKPLPAVKREEGYYATTAIAENALNWLRGHQKDHAAAPFFLYLAFTSPHFPLHALQPDIERFRGKYDMGWDQLRQARWERATQRGVVKCKPAALEPEVWPPWNTKAEELAAKIGPGEAARAVPWNTLTPEQKQFQSLKMAIHAAMIYRMDVEIGRVLDQLKAMGSMEDTCIVFISDNGASAEQLIRADGHVTGSVPGSADSHLGLGPGWSSAANSPFRMHKSWVHEGGISSPCIVHWPRGITDKGKLRHTPAHFIDILPTLADLAGAAKPPTLGKSLVPAFAKDRAIERDFIFFHHLDNRAIRVGDWKLVANGKGPWELYNLKADRGETTNLVTREPGRAKLMAEHWERLNKEFAAQRVQ
ncbi:MAG: arylsulfatase [Bryobacterales bacterium]|nr:arylsulfatase [Bryobacterales bacterium]